MPTWRGGCGLGAQRVCRVGARGAGQNLKKTRKCSAEIMLAFLLLFLVQVGAEKPNFLFLWVDDLVSTEIFFGLS